MPEFEEVIGVFIGLQSSTYEYIATIIAPYKSEFSIEIGNFLLIQDEPFKLVSRVIDFVPQGELTSFMGQKWLSDVALESEAIGGDIKRRKISYAVKIKILGTLDSKNIFIPGLRKIPHITSRVVRPDSKVVRQIIHQVMDEQEKGSKIGNYFLDEEIPVKFDPRELLGKRTFIFARAGYGKSNLMKVLASEWTQDFGSLLVFDPDGEYALTDSQGRPGVMDKKEAILITNRHEKPEVKNIYRRLKFNLKEFDPHFILPIIIPPEKREMIFFQKLMQLDQSQWNRLVDLFFDKGWGAELKEIDEVVGVADSDPKDMAPIRNNLILPIRTIHDPQSRLMTIIRAGIRKGAIIIVDVSRLNSRIALWLTSIVIQDIFNKNQENFISGSPEGLMRVTFGIDEAQSVLSRADDSNFESFVTLAKEGRKYLLGGIFITQQPGSIPFEILSQADNFFVFHLLSRGDLESLQKANAHYSNDIITQTLNEPKRGKCYMWTSAQPFVLPVQITKFDDIASADKAKDVQMSSQLLSSIINEEIAEKSPILKSILGKYKEVEAMLAGAKTKERTITLYRKLDEKEKGYLRPLNAIQVGTDGIEFAIKFPYYKELAIMAGSLVEGPESL